MATNFDSLLNSLHSGLKDTPVLDNYIQIDEKRQFIPTKAFNTVIAYEGDVNSQLVTFKSIKSSDEHDLSGCGNHELRWRNQKSNLEGISKLKIEQVTNEEEFCLIWEVPLEACTEAGSLQISISCYDRVKLESDTEGTATGPIAFSWNTSEYTGLSIGKSMERVGFYMPAKDEILIVDKDTRNIVAPQNYNNIVGNFGESGVANVYFSVSRYLGKDNNIDIMAEDTIITLYIVIPEVMAAKTTSISKRLYAEEIFERKNEGLVLLTWLVPKEITANSKAYAGQFSIAVSVESNNNTFMSNTYSKLEVGDSLIRSSIPVDPSQPPEELKTAVFKYIEEYFTINDVSFFSDLTSE